VKALHASLLQRGIVFQEAPHLIARLQDREVWLAALCDPDRNVLHLMSEFKVPQTDS
jgi:methylmalonyl-CoA/ethylmalonyl-CoA epimerase